MMVMNFKPNFIRCDP